MAIKVEEGYMRGVVVDENGDVYIYLRDDEKTGKNLFKDLSGRWYEEISRDSKTGDVIEIQLRGDL